MDSVYVLLLLIVSASGIVRNHRQRFPGPYCRDRRPEQCCPSRDDTCTVPIKDTVCYCDQFCALHNSEDCCPDYEDVCQGIPRPTTTPPSNPIANECYHLGKLYALGQSIKKNCNTCTCVKLEGSSTSVQSWQCENLACINDQDLVNGINTGNYGWTAKTYNKFDGVSLRDGIKYYLGTTKPKAQVVRLNPIKIEPDELFEREFLATDKWPLYIHPAMDQGECAASWAFSTASVAADRWGIQSDGDYLEQLSVQNMISCSFVEGCSGGRIEDAWYFLQREGAVPEVCYPYTSGTTKSKGQCKYLDEMTCQDAHVHKTTPPYRVANDEKQIMKEIKQEGPVQAIILVRADFYLYEGGVYSHTNEELRLTESDHSITGTHSVKIIGWGEESNGVKYWLCVNSWGQRWGEDGTFKIKRGANESGIEEFVVGVWARVEAHNVASRKLRRHRHK